MPNLACHNVEQSKPVPPLTVGLKQLWPGYRPIVLMPRVQTLSPVQNSPGIARQEKGAAEAAPFLVMA
ncbi:MAG: hypothetical protein M3N39_07300 [Pseudomonadota bacterium]|nr:hypothetical protein [Pseudomonadota bacterium]